MKLLQQERCTYIDNEHVQIDECVPAMLTGREVTSGQSGLIETAVKTDQFKVNVDISLVQLHSSTCMFQIELVSPKGYHSLGTHVSSQLNK